MTGPDINAAAHQGDSSGAAGNPSGADKPPTLRPIVPKATRSMDELLARLWAPSQPANDPPAPAPQTAATTDYGAPDGDALAQAAAVLNEAAHTAELEHLVAERTDDLQRLQAEYANYRKRVERDRAVARQQGGEAVVRELVPIWDAISQAASHEELTGGFKAVAGEFARVAEKLGLSSFGTVGDEFDPNMHDALMQMPAADVAPGHVAQVIQPGYRMGDVVLRPARVAVAAPRD
ncbi:MAG: nucleotide exchange factor GrpE [Propionibacteriaceae bacterium]|nr:nucleotide exchange factor GrpE [Propionibacteriaceae bacterium]